MEHEHNPGDLPVSRRRAIRMAGAAGLASAATVAGATPAEAQAGQPLLLETTNTASKTTRLDITGGDGKPHDNPGVHLRTDTARDALRVHSEHGNGILATCNHDDQSTAAVTAYGTHLGVYAQVNSPNAPAVWGQGVGVGSRGLLGWATGTDGTAVHGLATDGVGGLFEGTKANINLRPVPAAASHPTPGTTGDLFVDRTGRLWYCRAGGNPATWVQLA